ncbi:hypothetical protein HDZ31DRAFT_40239 [Schizophyllum fasciatum]
MDPTAKFQEALHLSLLPVAPGLSAVHATRCRRAEASPTLADSCSKCGAHALDGTGSIRIARKPRSDGDDGPSSKSVTRTCRLCGWVDTLACSGQSNASAFPRMKHGRRMGAKPAPLQSAPSSPLVQTIDSALGSQVKVEKTTIVSSSTIQPTEPPGPRSRARKKKSSALQEMLARNKQSSQPQENNSSGQSRLAAFLHDL